MAPPIRILHLHSGFDLGGKEARAVQLMNRMGARARHVVLSAMPDAMGARSAIAKAIDVDFPGDLRAPPLHGKPAPGRYLALARYMQNFDLVLSYNWGAMDGVMAHRVCSRLMPLPPIIHHEDGFNADEGRRTNGKRNLFRRLALPTVTRIIVPSVTLEQVVRRHWGARLPLARISNGIATPRYAKPPAADAIPGLTRAPGDVVIGTVAGLRAVKNLTALVQAFADLPSHVRLVIVGEGPERAAILNAAAECGIAERVLLPGFMAEPWRYVGAFDIMALSSHSEQQPIAIMEGMAAGLPVVAPDVGDLASMVAAENAPFIVARDAVARDGGDPSAGLSAALSVALRRLVDNAGLRRTIGTANRAHAAAHFDEGVMFARYDAAYTSAVGMAPGSLLG